MTLYKICLLLLLWRCAPWWQEDEPAAVRTRQRLTPRLWESPPDLTAVRIVGRYQWILQRLHHILTQCLDRRAGSTLHRRHSQLHNLIPFLSRRTLSAAFWTECTPRFFQVQKSTKNCTLRTVYRTARYHKPRSLACWLNAVDAAKLTRQLANLVCHTWLILKIRNK